MILIQVIYKSFFMRIGAFFIFLNLASVTFLDSELSDKLYHTSTSIDRYSLAILIKFSLERRNSYSVYLVFFLRYCKIIHFGHDCPNLGI